jgi:type I restriction enzyme S subunit
VSELPMGWVYARVGDLIEVGPRSDCADNTIVGFVPLNQLGVTFLSRHTFVPRPWSEVRKGYTHFADGDVLLARITPSFENGKAGIVRGLPNGLGAGSTEYFVCRPRDQVLLPEYLLAHFKTRPFLRDGEQVMSGAVGQQRVPKQYVLDSQVPLAPLPEQKRIADKLDALLARVDACRGRLDRVPGILKRFRQSVLAAATSGELTREWRVAQGGEPGTESWISTKLVNICFASRVITYGVVKLGDETPRGIPCLRTSNVRWLRVETDGMKRIAPALSAEFGRTVLKGGEVLVNVRGTLGGVAVVESTMRGWNVSREVAVVPVDNERVNSHFLAFWIGSDDRQRWLSKVEKGVAYTGINIEDLRTLPVSVPPIKEQIEIVRRAQALLEAADEIEMRHAAIVRATAPLTPSLLAKAFRGELVPQDPIDEPASKLLVRLRTRPDFTGSTSKAKRGGTRGSRTKAKEQTSLVTRKGATPNSPDDHPQGARSARR